MIAPARPTPFAGEDSGVASFVSLIVAWFVLWQKRRASKNPYVRSERRGFVLVSGS